MRSDTPIWISAEATAAAVIVALFGPPVRRWWGRPRITLHQPADTLLPNDELILASSDDERRHQMQFVTLEVTNHGRTQLDDLEAVLSAYHVDAIQDGFDFASQTVTITRETAPPEAEPEPLPAPEPEPEPEPESRVT